MMNPQDKDIVETFHKFIACGFPFNVARKKTFDTVQPDMPWETFKRKLDQLVHNITP